MRIPRERFELMVSEIIEALPPDFREKLEDVAVVVMDEPTPEQLEELGGDPDDPPLGVYLGPSLVDQSVLDTQFEPNTIVLYQRLIEEVCRNEVEVAEEVRLTLLHEIAHHFGIDEGQMPESVR